MNKVKVNLRQTIEIEVPPYFNEEVAKMYAYKKAREKFHNANNHNGAAMVQFELADGTCTDWYNM